MSNVHGNSISSVYNFEDGLGDTSDKRNSMQVFAGHFLWQKEAFGITIYQADKDLTLSKGYKGNVDSVSVSQKHPDGSTYRVSMTRNGDKAAVHLKSIEINDASGKPSLRKHSGDASELIACSKS